MGWGRTLLLGDIGNQMNIDDVNADLEGVKDMLRGQHDTDASQDEALRRLQEENQELKLYMATLLKLLVSKNVLTNEELTRFVNLLEPA
jgi:hypothetical protein